MAVPERTRWPDERLDDFAAEIHMLKAMPIRVASLTAETQGMRRDLDRLANTIDTFDDRLDTALNVFATDQAEHRGESRAEERRAERSHKWHTRVASWTNAVIVAVAAAVGAIVTLIFGGHHP